MPRNQAASTFFTAPFASGAEAWFWTMAALRARAEGVRSTRPGLPRPCEPDDVVNCLENLFHARKIDARHARVMRKWGEQQRQPDPYLDSPHDVALWREALAQMERPLRRKGIIKAPM